MKRETPAEPTRKRLVNRTSWIACAAKIEDILAQYDPETAKHALRCVVEARANGADPSFPLAKTEAE